MLEYGCHVETERQRKILVLLTAVACDSWKDLQEPVLSSDECVNPYPANVENMVSS